MKIHNPQGRSSLSTVVFFAALLSCPAGLPAQLPVKGVYASRFKATTGSTYIDTISTGSGLSGKYTYNYGTKTVTSNNYQRLDSFTVGGSMYVFDSIAVPVVKIRRANNAWVTGLRKAVWMESDGNTPSATVPVGLRPAYDDSLEDIFTKRLFNMGVDNAFENGTGTNNNNIERIDIIFPSGLKAMNPDSAGFTVFDRGAAGTNDSFMIAGIKALDANGDPSDYYPAVKVGPLNYGAATGTALNFHALRKDPSEPDLRLFLAAGNQAREGVYFSFRSLGFPYSSGTSGLRIYGYSVMSTDVNLAAPGTPKNIVFYSNNTIFPTTTELGSVGGLDMVAVTGVAATTTTFAMLTLPVLISEWTARPQDNKVVLSWQQSTSTDLSQLRVERSSNGIVFLPLAGLNPPTKNGLRVQVDDSPLPGQNYYRLQLVDNAGDISYSPIVQVSMNATGSQPLSIAVYPVPVCN
ncbi:MAG TPA: hypothetical protein VGM41_21895, partial [Chitinophagaceae bacterium]